MYYYEHAVEHAPSDSQIRCPRFNVTKRIFGESRDANLSVYLDKLTNTSPKIAKTAFSAFQELFVERNSREEGEVLLHSKAA